MIWFIAGTVWLLIAIGVSIVAGKGIKLADRMEQHLVEF